MFKILNEKASTYEQDLFSVHGIGYKLETLK